MVLHSLLFLLSLLTFSGVALGMPTAPSWPVEPEAVTQLVGAGWSILFLVVLPLLIGVWFLFKLIQRISSPYDWDDPSFSWFRWK